MQNQSIFSPQSRRAKFGQLLLSPDDDTTSTSDSRLSSASPTCTPTDSSPYNTTSTSTSSPWSASQSPYSSSPYIKSPWAKLSPLHHRRTTNYTLIGSLVRREGHVYSIACSAEFLYTGSDSRSIRVWSKTRLHDSGGFRSGSGLVKAIMVVSLHGKVFTGHQDGKIRVWKRPPPGSGSGQQHKRAGSLPTWKEYLKSSVDPRKYVEVGRHKRVPPVRHFDAVSCMGLNEAAGLLYSGSWDRTVKVWRLADCRCLETVAAHDDAVNAVAVGFDGLVFTGAADGTVKVWRRELDGNNSRHLYVETLLEQASAVTSLAVSCGGATDEGVLYSGSSDGLVNFWEWRKRLSYGGVLRGHKLAVLCLVAAGRLVLSGSADNTICAWRREPGGVHVCVAVLTGHAGPVKCLAVEEDHGGDDDDDGGGGGGDRRWIVYSGSLDKSVRVWRVYEDARAA